MYTTIVIVVILISLLQLRSTVKCYFEEKKHKDIQLNNINDTITEIRKYYYLLNRVKIIQEEFINNMKNEFNLQELVEHEAGEKEYQEYVDLMIESIKKAYDNFEFNKTNPVSGQEDLGWRLEFVLSKDKTENYNELRKAILSNNLEGDKISEMFSESVEDGEVLELGEAVVNGMYTGVGGTALSDSFQAMISFTTPQFEEEVKEAKEKAKEQAEKDLAEEREKEKKQVEAYAKISAVQQNLDSSLRDALEESHPEVLENMDELYKTYTETLD